MSPARLNRAQRSVAALAATAAVCGCATHSPMRHAPGMMEESVTSADGVRIAYEVWGEGATGGAPALVLVHGWSCDRSYWAGQLEPFSRKYRVVALDLAGHGASGRERAAYTMASFGDDVAAVVNELGLEHVILVGHSMGGDVIAEAARRLPGRVAGLVWVDTYRQLGRGRSDVEVEAFVAQLRADFPGATRTFVRSMFLPTSDPAVVERVAAGMSSAPPAVALSALGNAFRYSREMPRTLDELKLRTIAINPDNGPTDVESMRRHGVEVMIVPGGSHFLPQEDPARFNRVLQTAIDTLLAR